MNSLKLQCHDRLQHLTVLTIATLLASLVGTTWSESASGQQQTFSRRLYLGAGFGASTLQPNPREPEILTVGEDSDVGFHLNLGYDINRWVSAELYLASLGHARLDRIDQGNAQSGLDNIDYLIADVSAIGYLFNSRSGLSGSDTTVGTYCREALSVYGRLGLGVMRNDDEFGRITHGRNYSQHVTVGLGLEYGFHNGVGIRGEWIGFDSDARYMNVALVKRFGDSTCQQSDDPVAPIVPIKPVIQTMEPQLGTAIEIMPPVSYFGFDSSTPNAESIQRLAAFTAAISTTPGTVELTGHTDSSGSNTYNERLSERRVRAVQQLMIENGIAPARIRIHYKGELNPVSSNASTTGRALNRRVEIIFVEDQ